jgi:hypothetical protein
VFTYSSCSRCRSCSPCQRNRCMGPSYRRYCLMICWLFSVYDVLVVLLARSVRLVRIFHSWLPHTFIPATQDIRFFLPCVQNPIQADAHLAHAHSPTLDPRVRTRMPASRAAARFLRPQRALDRSRPRLFPPQVNQ